MNYELNIENFNQFVLNKAIEVASKSQCNRKKVGAVLTFNPKVLATNYREFGEIDYNDAIICTGYNKSLDLDNSCEEIGCLFIDGSCQRTQHAEINCLLNKGYFKAFDKWLYITTVPCIKCFQYIVQNEIKVIWYGDDSYWKTHTEHASYILGMAKKYEIKIGKV